MIIYDAIMRYESQSERIKDRDTLDPEKDSKTFKEMLSEINDSLDVYRLYAFDVRDNIRNVQ